VPLLGRALACARASSLSPLLPLGARGSSNPQLVQVQKDGGGTLFGVAQNLALRINNYYCLGEANGRASAKAKG